MAKSATTESAVKSRSRTIHPTDIFSLSTATELLGVRLNTLPREIRLRRLRASKRGGRYFLLGEWLLEWLRAGEVRKAAATAETVEVLQ